MGGQVYLSIRFYLYGDQAAAAAARAEPVWQAWMNEHFPIVVSPRRLRPGEDDTGPQSICTPSYGMLTGAIVVDKTAGPGDNSDDSAFDGKNTNKPQPGGDPA